MEQTEEMQQAIDYLEKYWKKGHKERGKAMCLLSLGQIGGRSELLLIHREKCGDSPSHQHTHPEKAKASKENDGATGDSLNGDAEQKESEVTHE